MCGFENVLKRGQCGGNLCNDPCWDVYKGVCLLKRFSFVFESCFESVVMCGLENRQVFCFARVSNQELSTLNFSKIFAMF